MKLHFDPNQQYQLDAVKFIIDIFDGRPLSQGDFASTGDSPMVEIFSEMKR